MSTQKLTSIPFIGGQGSTRDEILAILSEEFPFSAKEIYARVKRQGRNVSYQAVHKTLQSLIEQRVLEKQNSTYLIQKEWITNIRDHLTILEHQYQEKPSAKKVLEEAKKTTVKLHFSSLTTMSVFTAELLGLYREQTKRPVPHFAFLRHAWWPLKFEPSQYFLFKRMDDNNPNNRVVVIKNDPFDKWIVRYYMLVNSSNRLRFEEKAKWEEDLIVKGDLVLQTRYSKETLKRMDDIYQKISGLTELFDTYFVNIGKDEGFDIDITISHNPTMAKLITEKIKGYFGE
ncbi:MAG: transcriptional repressor [Candidatus Diapherotrites archaeon]|nr:transcriptional repressor [Candidatus Diapherotrites archaeon]